MESPSKSVLGGGLITAFVLGGLVSAAVLVDPGAPPARAADGLTPFDSCAQLQSWYVDHTIDQVGPYGWGGRAWTARESGPMEDSSGDEGASSSKAQDMSPSPETGEAVSNGETGTNTQEAGVDEPDVAKTDGRIVVRLVENKRLVVTDVTGESAREIADLVLPSDGYATGLLLVDDHVLLTGDRGVDLMLEDDGTDRSVPTAGTELYDVDVSDPANPRLDSRTSWSGRQLSLRQYDDTVRLVTSNGLPQLPFVEPGSGSDSGFGEMSENEAAERNREIVRKSTVQDWAPGLDCSDVYHPRTWSGSETVSVATFRPGAVDAATEVAVTGAGNEVYSSADRLYVTATDWGDQVFMDRPTTSAETIPDSVRAMPPTRTHLHAFALEGDSTRYLASGDINGSIKDRWSLDENDGHLRVAVSWPGRDGQTGENGVVVLDERDGRLETVGELRGLGVEEEIKSVRWFDDLAVVVTFRQTDPLYTIDLTDPTRPRRLGELKIPGFSSYLHPIGDDRLLGLGTDADLGGRTMGAQAAVFDISDRSRARQVGRVTFGESLLGASEDPHAFTWLPGADAAITTLQSSGVDPGVESGTESDTHLAEGSTMILLRVSPSGALSTEQLPSPGGYEQRSLPLDDGRVALTGSTVTLVDVEALR